jgi:hypothetical protein
MIRPMLRISWLLVLLVLLKLGMGMNSAAATLPTQHPVQGHLADSHPCHENTATEVSKNKAPTTETAASSDAQSTLTTPLTTPTHLAESTCGDCQWCCAWGLSARKVSLAPAAPASPPQGFTLSWISQSLQPELRPPLV